MLQVSGEVDANGATFIQPVLPHARAHPEGELPGSTDGSTRRPRPVYGAKSADVGKNSTGSVPN